MHEHADRMIITVCVLFSFL